MTDWNAWSRIVDAAQDPQYREAVQRFLAQTELSADIPAALDEKFLAPRRPAEATEEQCAYLLCNLGFAALVRASGESAAFAMACGQVAEQLAPDTPDLTLRRLFLSAKGSLVNALLANQPHVYWDDVTDRCTTYLGTVDEYLESLPAEAIEGNAMAAYSFAGKTLSQIASFGATAHYADEVASLVSKALRLEDRLPASLASRISSTIMPGTDAFVSFREAGAAAERALQGEAASTGERPALPSPSSDQAVDAWCAEWLADNSGDHWTRQSDSQPRLEDIRSAWAREAMAAAESGDAAEFIAAVDRVGGFLADSLLLERQQWAQRLSPPDQGPPWPDRGELPQEAPAGDPAAALGEVFDAIGEDTALLHVALTEEGILTAATRRQDGELVFSPAPQTRSARGLRNAHKAWSRAHFQLFHDGPGNSEGESGCATTFAALLDEVDDTWGDVLRNLLDADATRLVLIGDDLVDIPLHAARTGNGDERLIDRVTVSFAPSLTALRVSIDRTERGEPPELAPPVSAAFNDHGGRMLELDARLEHNARMPFDSVISFGDHDLSLAEFVAGLDLSYCDAVSSLACESALPSMLRAPGFDLAALFLAAGARNVLASSWQTEDALATEMMQVFFSYRAAGQSPAAAFQKALFDLRSGHSPLPDYLWAGMRLVGAP